MASDTLIRVGDAERNEVAAKLSEHYAAGRLTMAELDQRLEIALSAQSRQDLAGVLSDLPSGFEEPPPAPVRRRVHESTEHARRPVAGWAVTSTICLVIWLVTSIATGTFLYFWPIWVIGPWGVALVGRVIRGQSRITSGTRHSGVAGSGQISSAGEHYSWPG